MRKVAPGALLPLFILLAPAWASAAEPIERTWAVKADGGVAFPRSSDAAFGGTLGLSYTWSVRAHKLVPLTSNLVLQPELGVVTRAFTVTPTESLTTRNRVSHARVPVSIAYRLGGARRALRVFAGPWLGVFLGGSAYSVLQDVEVEEGEEGSDLMDAGFIRNPLNRSAITPVDIGAVAGAALDVSVGDLGMVLELRYDVGFLKFARAEINQTRLSAVALGLGVSF